MTNVEAMNSVTENKQRLDCIFTKDMVARIPMLVQQGLSAETIAARLGCTVGTLRVRCSQAQISFARAQSAQGGANGAGAQAAKAEADAWGGPAEDTCN